jgi:type I restriction enzyme M protein
MGKTNPLNDADLAEFVELQASRASADEGPVTKKSWNVDARSLSTAEGYDLSVKNPNGGEEVIHRSPQAIMDEIAALDAESADVLANIRGLL